MSDYRTADLLVELGCEELPPHSLGELAESFFKGVCAGLDAEGIVFDPASSRALYTPRRLAMVISGVADRQPDRMLERRGPALSAAFGAGGEPTRAALGFAASVGRDVSELETLKTDKGEWLFCKIEEPGKALRDVVFTVLQEALNRLPVARPMRWSGHEYSFVRPVHWLVVMHGDRVLEGTLYGQDAGRITWGHRIHDPGPHEIDSPADYERVLRNARVMVDQAARRDTILGIARAEGERLGGNTRITDSLLEEVNNLVEWPVAVGCHYDKSFLDVPQEALIASMEDHQKFFPLLDGADGRLVPQFIAIANLESSQPDAVREGFERVIRPRLADAQFFWEQDVQRPLEASLGALDDIVFQEKLGSIGDKCRRISRISKNLAEDLEIDPEHAGRAASLSKCDLVSQMVGEFPELQGIMGGYYARESGEEEPVCTAIREHYAPRFAGDDLPESIHGQLVSLADRLDSVVGIFSAGLQPTGNKDPFALRRAALGIVRILIEKNIGIPLDRLLTIAADGLKESIQVSSAKLSEIRGFILDRARSHLRDSGFSTKLINGAFAAPLDTLPDLHARLIALDRFMTLPAAESLVAANKRIGNILRKSDENFSRDINEDILDIGEEKTLFDEIIRLEAELGPLFANSEYSPALEELAKLQETVAGFFDGVMVMVDDPAIRANRLALLGRLKGLFDHVADLSLAA